jgi:uncharacterized protein YlaI
MACDAVTADAENETDEVKMQPIMAAEKCRFTTIFPVKVILKITIQTKLRFRLNNPRKFLPHSLKSVLKIAIYHSRRSLGLLAMKSEFYCKHDRVSKRLINERIKFFLGKKCKMRVMITSGNKMNFSDLKEIIH